MTLAMRITQATFSDLANSRKHHDNQTLVSSILGARDHSSCGLALAIAPTDSRIRKRHDFTQSTTGEWKILFPALAKDGMTWHRKTTSAIVASAKALPVQRGPTISTAGRPF